MSTAKERPIIFSTDMVSAILGGRKTMTRRIYKNADPKLDLWAIFKHSAPYILSQCPYGKPSDKLWVRETWCDDLVADGEGDPLITFKADFPELTGVWKPSIHMPKAAARIWLEVTDVRVERLQDLKKQEALAEGVYYSHSFEGYTTNDDASFFHSSDPITVFRRLWTSLNGPDSWYANPWVWVISFKVLSTTGKPC
jgi:hypothetical protein